MKILAVETSTLLGGIALSDDVAGLVAETRMNIKTTHSERLMAQVDSVLQHSGIQLSDIDVFAAAIGPGSFTGLRIGLSTVKGFSYATGNPLVAVPTLEALAWHFPYSSYPVCTLLDARKQEVYAAVFQWHIDGFVRIMDEVSIGIGPLLDNIGDIRNTLSHAQSSRQHTSGKVIFTGEGSALYREDIIRHMGSDALFATPDKMVPSPAHVATLGLRKAMRSEFSEPISLVPLYVRRSEAEIKWGR
jgi:tRNA threonylcarbamoyladenosine biosynthesis protein TsaB